MVSVCVVWEEMSSVISAWPDEFVITRGKLGTLEWIICFDQSHVEIETKIRAVVLSVLAGGSYAGSETGIKRQMSIPADRASLVDNMEYDVISYGGTEVMSERGRPAGRSKAGSKPGKSPDCLSLIHI